MTSEEYLDSLLKSMEETEVNQSDNPLIKKIITDFEEEQTEDNTRSLKSITGRLIITGGIIRRRGFFCGSCCF